MNARSALVVILLVGYWTAVSARPAAGRSYAVRVFEPAGIFAASGNGLSAGDIVGSGVGPATGGYSHALLFPQGADEPIDLHPVSGYVDTSVEGVSGDTEVGWGSIAFPPVTHALLWRGSAESVIDLHPDGYSSSYGWDASSDTQVGSGSVGCCGSSTNHALFWRGSAASAVDLHPDGYTSSTALGASEGVQVGWAHQNAKHAVMWRGTADSMVELHSPGFFSSVAVDATDTHQVGNVDLSSDPTSTRAALWSGSAESYVNLHNDDYVASGATDVAGAYQVGFGETTTENGSRHALIWRGSAEQVINLQEVLAAQVPGFVGSIATGVDADGNAVGSGWTENRTWYIVQWSVVAGDTNGDLRVDLEDLNNVRNHFGSAGVGVLGDSNDDGVVDLVDLNDVRNHFGGVSAAPVPEPSAFALLSVAIMVFAGIRSGKRPILCKATHGSG